MRLPALLLIATLASSSGCSALIAGAAHDHHGQPVCNSGPIPATIDLVLASGMLAVVATQDARRGYYALPAVFFTSGVIGGISAARCAANEEKVTMTGPLTNSAPSFGDAEVDPNAVPATPEDLGLAPVEPTIPITAIGPHPAQPTLTLDPTYDIGPGKPVPPTPLAPPKKTDERIACGDSPGSCPKGQMCAVAGDDAGFCVRDRGR